MKQTDFRNIIYSTDASQISGNTFNVFIPETIEELQKIVRQNNKIAIRGSGTGIQGGSVPNGTLLSLEKLDKIIEIDSRKAEVYLESGVLMKDLHNQLKKESLELQFESFFNETETIGGLLALNSLSEKGQNQIIDLVNEIDVVNGSGNLIKIKKTDLSEFIGMEGITGVIVRARLFVSSIKEKSGAMLKIDDIRKLVNIVKKIRMLKDVYSISFFDKSVSELIGLTREYYLFVEFSSLRGKIKIEDYKKVMKYRQFAYHNLVLAGYKRFEDIKLFLDKIPEFILALEKARIPVFGNLINGMFHPFFPDNYNMHDILKVVKKMHGKVFASYGIGIRKKKYLDENEIKLIKRVKKRNDVVGKFNSRKLIDYDENQDEEKTENIGEFA